MRVKCTGNERRQTTEIAVDCLCRSMQRRGGGDDMSTKAAAAQHLAQVRRERQRRWRPDGVRERKVAPDIDGHCVFCL